MAPPRKTIEELKASGTYRPSRHGKRLADSLVSEEIDITVPETYDEVTKKEFRRVSIYLKSRGILSDMDLTSLYDAFNVFAENQRIYKILKQTSVIEDNYKALYTMYSTGVKTFNQIIKQFGAVPAERSKVSDLEKKKKDPTKQTIMDALK